MPRVKVCGVTRVEDVELLDGRVDYIGFITGLRASPRVLDPKAAAELASSVGRSRRVLVVYGLEPGEAAELASKLEVFQVVQYHWYAKPRELRELSRMLSDIGVGLAPVVFHGVAGWTPLHPVFYSRLSAVAEYTLVDAPKSSPVRHEGGLKVPPEAYAEAARVLVRPGAAGGITPDNVCIAARHAWLIDVSSGVEKEPGRKDPELLEKLLENIRSCREAEKA